MTTNTGLRSRLSKDFLFQALYIGIAVFLGLAAATLVIDDVLIKQALKGESEFYWETVENRPDLALPETRNMISYRTGISDNIPPELAAMELGFHRVTEPNKALAYITENNGERLIQVFDSARVDWLVTWFGLVPLAIVLAGVYLALYRAYRVSSRAVSPIVNLANRVKQLDPANPDLTLFAATEDGTEQDEIHTLNSAMHGLSKRLAQFAQREFDFTRDASHELRSPLTVIKIATQNLENRHDFSEPAQEMLAKVKSSIKDMEELTDAFLLLARESAHSLPTELISINQTIDIEIERAGLLIGDRPLAVIKNEQCHLSIQAPERVIASVIGNILRNSVTYTERGEVQVDIGEGHVTIKDSGPGMNESQLANLFKPFSRGSGKPRSGGYGVGLTIVKRLCERFDWPLNVESIVGEGTTVTVKFPDAESN